MREDSWNKIVIIQCGSTIITWSAVKIFSTEVLKEDFPVYFLRDGDDDNNVLTLGSETRAYWRLNKSSRLRPGLVGWDFQWSES